MAVGGPVLHSCGNFSDKLETVMKIPGIEMVDAAFTELTDPSPNPPSLLRKLFKGSEVILNARMIGDSGMVESVMQQLYSPGIRIIAVTYSQTAEEQKKVYDNIHRIFTG